MVVNGARGEARARWMTISGAQQVLSARAQRVPHGLETRLAVAGMLVCLGAVAMAAAGAQGDAAFGRGLLELLIVGGPIAVGLYALRAPVNKSFGIAMLGIGFAWSLTALAESTLSVPFTIGRLATWLTYPCVVYLLLAFPHGRIEKGLDRTIFLGVVGSAIPTRANGRTHANARSSGRRLRPRAAPSRPSRPTTAARTWPSSTMSHCSMTRSCSAASAASCSRASVTSG